METMMQLQIITPDRLLCDEPVRMVEMRTAEGEIGVLPGHIPVTVMMVPGVAHITTAKGVRHVAIHDGFVEIRPDRVTIMAELAEWPEDIDVERAKAALARARERFMEPDENTDIPRARRAWERAKTRIELISRQW